MRSPNGRVAQPLEHLRDVLGLDLAGAAERHGGEDDDELGVAQSFFDVQRQVAGEAFDPAPLAGRQLAAFDVPFPAAVVGRDAVDDDVVH